MCHFESSLIIQVEIAPVHLPTQHQLQLALASQNQGNLHGPCLEAQESFSFSRHLPLCLPPTSVNYLSLDTLVLCPKEWTHNPFGDNVFVIFYSLRKDQNNFLKRIRHTYHLLTENTGRWWWLYIISIWRCLRDHNRCLFFTVTLKW